MFGGIMVLQFCGFIYTCSWTHSAPFESFYSFEMHKINIHYAYFTMDYKDVTRNVPYKTWEDIYVIFCLKFLLEVHVTCD